MFIQWPSAQPATVPGSGGLGGSTKLWFGVPGGSKTVSGNALRLDLLFDAKRTVVPLKDDHFNSRIPIIRLGIIAGNSARDNAGHWNTWRRCSNMKTEYSHIP